MCLIHIGYLCQLTMRPSNVRCHPMYLIIIIRGLATIVRDKKSFNRLQGRKIKECESRDELREGKKYKKSSLENIDLMLTMSFSIRWAARWLHCFSLCFAKSNGDSFSVRFTGSGCFCRDHLRSKRKRRCLPRSRIYVSYGGGRRRQTSASIFMTESNNLFGDFA